jgi:hypothetical protein
MILYKICKIFSKCILAVSNLFLYFYILTDLYKIFTNTIQNYYYFNNLIHETDYISRSIIKSYFQEINKMYS